MEGNTEEVPPALGEFLRRGSGHLAIHEMKTIHIRHCCSAIQTCPLVQLNSSSIIFTNIGSKMISRGLRRFATTAYRTAEVASKTDASNSYGVQLSKAQGYVNGFVGGDFEFIYPSSIV
ncbi:MAG: hypothetical protein Q9211_000214 [Gyalolechia sp. 1 TL-2023]